MFDNSFKIPYQALLDYVSAFPTPAHLKDPQTKRYLYTNEANLKIYGLTQPQQLIGLSIYDLDNFMQPCWGNDFARQIDLLDQQVVQQVTMVSAPRRILLDKYGLIHIQNMTKVPIINEHNIVSAILTTVFDVTNTLDRLTIFEYYQQHYQMRREANEYFMRHVRICYLFSDILTTKEIECLLYMVENNAYKFVANRMGVSVKTIEAHNKRITNKIKQGTTISDILESLRAM